MLIRLNCVEHERTNDNFVVFWTFFFFLSKRLSTQSKSKTAMSLPRVGGSESVRGGAPGSPEIETTVSQLVLSGIRSNCH